MNVTFRARPYGKLFSLAGRQAVVTGGGGGLGRMFALALADAGAEVTVADIAIDAARETAEMVNGRAIHIDVADPESVERAARELEGTTTGLHVLVNNAGISTRSQRTHEISVADWDRVITVNLRGTFLVSRAFIPLMLRTPGPRSIINIASTVGVRALDPEILAQAGYVASKAGVIGLTMQMAVEYGGDNIRVNAIAPGWHLGTNLGARIGNFRTPESMERLVEQLQTRTPLRRTGDPTELAGLLLYLASDASSFVTGQVISHDGGWTAL